MHLICINRFYISECIYSYSTNSIPPTWIHLYCVSYARPSGSEKYLNVHPGTTGITNDDQQPVPGTGRVTQDLVLSIPTPYGYQYTGSIGQHPRKCFMCIQCGQFGIDRPRKPCQSNGYKYNQSEYE